MSEISEEEQAPVEEKLVFSFTTEGYLLPDNERTKEKLKLKSMEKQKRLQEEEMKKQEEELRKQENQKRAR